MQNEVYRHGVAATVRDDNISILHDWLDELVVTWLNKSVVLLEDVLDGPASLGNIPLDTSGQSDVIVGHDEDLEVHEVSKPLLVQGHDPLEDHDWLSLDGFGFADFPKQTDDRIVVFRLTYLLCVAKS